MGIKKKVAVYIDAANLEQSAKAQHWRVDYRKLRTWLRKKYSVAYLGFYSARFDTPSHDAFLTVLKKTGYLLVTKPIKHIRNKEDPRHKRKANFDVEIAVEAMKLVDEYGEMVLFSGDSDFTYLLRELQKRGKHIVVISTKYHVARELVSCADTYIDLRKIRNEIRRTPRLPSKSPSFTTGG